MIRLPAAAICLFLLAAAALFPCAAESVYKSVEFETASHPIAANGGYCRLAELSDGTILAAYSAGAYIYVSRSTDGGLTFGSRVQVTNSQYYTVDGFSCTNAEIIVLGNGDILVAYDARNRADSSYSIRVNISHDNGVSWEHHSTVAEVTSKAGGGFWEPFLFVADGELYVYYCNSICGIDTGKAYIDGFGAVRIDSIFPGFPIPSTNGTAQHVMVQKWNEKASTWGNPVIASDGASHNSRDGMMVVTEMADGNYAMVIESTMHRNDADKRSFVIQMMFSKDAVNWTSPVDVFISPGYGTYAGAPYVVTLPDGRLAVSYQTTYRYTGNKRTDTASNCVMEVMVSNETITYANCSRVGTQSFTKLGYPMPEANANATAIWPSLFIYGGRYLVAVAEVRNNTSTSSTVSSGLVLRRAYLGDAPGGYISIGNYRELTAIGKTGFMPLSGKYWLECDITVPKSYAGAASKASPFTGIIEGGGHTISGLVYGTSAVRGIFIGDSSGGSVCNLLFKATDAIGEFLGESGFAIPTNGSSALRYTATIKTDVLASAKLGVSGYTLAEYGITDTLSGEKYVLYDKNTETIRKTENGKAYISVVVNPSSPSAVYTFESYAVFTNSHGSSVTLTGNTRSASIASVAAKVIADAASLNGTELSNVKLIAGIN